MNGIPQYHTYNDIYTEFVLGQYAHANLMHRYSNDVMFVGYNDRTKKLYNEANKLWTILMTLSDLFRDNPIVKCSQLMDYNYNVPDDVSDDVKNTYIKYFSRLYTCLRNTIDHLDRDYRKGLTPTFIREMCSERFTQTTTGDPDCIIGDYSPLDYNNDYFIEVCNQNSVELLIDKLDDLYVVEKVDEGVSVSTADAHNLSVGDVLQFGYTASMEESGFITVLTIPNVNEFTVDTVVTGYNHFAKITEVDFQVVNTFLNITRDTLNYVLVGEDSTGVAVNTVFIVYDSSGNKYYDVMGEVNISDNVYTLSNTYLNGIDEPVKLEITNKILIAESSTVYAGTSTSTVLNEAQVLALSDVSEVRSGYTGDYLFSTGGYKYFAFPESFGGPDFFKDNGTADIAMWSGYPLTENGFTYYNVDIGGISYRVYRTSFIIGTILEAEVS